MPPFVVRPSTSPAIRESFTPPLVVRSSVRLSTALTVMPPLVVVSGQWCVRRDRQPVAYAPALSPTEASGTVSIDPCGRCHDLDARGNGFRFFFGGRRCDNARLNDDVAAGTILDRDAAVRRGIDGHRAS
jgi:hypothetical protein